MPLLFLFLAVIPASGAEQAPPLNEPFAALSRALKPATAVLKREMTSRRAANAAPAPSVREFNLEFRFTRWVLTPNINPNPSELTIAVTQGDHVKLLLTNWPNRQGSNDGASFDVDGLDATVNGERVNGIHVWLPMAAGQALVEFDASKPRVFLIYGHLSPVAGPIGRIVISAAKKA